MNENRRERLMAAGVLVLVALVFAGWLAFRERGDHGAVIQSQLLPDGSTLHLEAVLGGRSFVYDTDTLIQKIKRRTAARLPFLRRWFGYDPYFRKGFSSEGDMIAVVLSRRETPKPNSPPDSIYWEFEFSDGEGWRDRSGKSEFAQTLHRSRGQAAVRLLGVSTRAFPHHRRMLYLDVFDPRNTSEAKQMARFEIRNPVYRPAETQAAISPLPVTARDGDLEAALHQLISGVSDSYFTSLLPEGDPRLARTRKPMGGFEEAISAYATFTFREKGEVTRDWNLASLRVTDSADCRFPAEPLWGGDSGDHKCVRFQPNLWTGGGPFLLRAQFVRVNRFPEDELWTVSFRAPQTKEPVVINGVEKTLGPVRARLERVIGPRGRFSHYGMISLTATAQFVVEMPPDAPYRLEVIDAVDDLGRRRPELLNVRREVQPAATSVTCGVNLPRSFGDQWDVPSTTVTLKLALTRTRVMDFRAEAMGLTP